MTSETKTCQSCKTQFVIEPDDFGFYEKIKVPPPTFCPECRIRRRVIWRNEKTMYKRICDATGKEIFSMFHPKVPFKVYERDYWWSDAWDPMAYGRDYDFSKSFLAQLRELMHAVPWFSRSVVNLTNSDYCMNCSYLKNCYLLFHGSRDEGCYYNVGINDSKDSFDNLFIDTCELCYECFTSARCYKAFYADDCEDSQELYLCKDCKNCSNCVGCVGLRNKKYHILNQPYAKEEYFEKLKELKLDSRSGHRALQEQFEALCLTVPVKYMHAIHNTNVSGDYIYNSKNVHSSYLAYYAEDCKYCQNIILSPGSKNCYDYSFFGMNAELVYESCSVGIDAADIKFSALVYSGAQRITYSIACPSSQDLFGCVGLRKKQYCILNKQYTKEAFGAMVSRIIEHMRTVPYVDAKGRTYTYGEFFPFELCPFGYNETVAQEYFPVTKKEAEEKGYSWRDPESKEHIPTLSWRDMPDSINGTDESITEQTILCEAWDENSEKAREHNCSKAFRILPEELRFHKTYHLSLPRKCFNSRHFDRTQLRNPLKLWPRGCECGGSQSANSKSQIVYKNTASHFHSDAKCPNEFETSYAPERKEIVYCEQCYNAEVV